MRKNATKILIFSLFISSLAYGGMKEDITFLNDLYGQGRYEMAIQESKKFLSVYPKSKYNKDLCKRIGIISYLNGNYEESKLYFNKYMTEYKIKKSEKNEAYSYLYRISLLEKDMTKASYYKRIIQLDDNINESTDYETGILLLNNGRNEEALAHFDEAISLEGKNQANSFLYKSLVLMNLGRYKEALNSVNVYNNMNIKEKDMPLTTYLYGVLNYRLNNINKAIDYLESGLKNYPNDSYSLKGKLVLIEIYLNRSEATKALRLYSTLKDKNDIEKASKVFGSFFITKGEYTRAIDFFDKIPKKDQGTQYAYAYAYFKENNFEKAIKEFKKVNSEKYKTDVKYYEILSYYNLKNYAEVLKYENNLNDYLTDSKKYNDIRVAFASSAYETGDYKKSYDYYNEIHKDYPEIENLYRKMVVGKKLNDEKLMESIFAEYKEKYPEDKNYKKEIYNLLGEFYYKNNNMAKAENTYKEFLGTEKEVGMTNKLVDLLVNEKKYPEVLEYLNTLEPTDENEYLKGISYMGIGNYSEANKFFDKLSQKEKLDPVLDEKVRYSTIKNNFLWEKYQTVLTQGRAYVSNENAYRIDDIIDIIGISYYRLENFRRAREYFTILQKYRGRYSYSKYQIADTYFAEKNYEKALELYQEIGNNKDYQKDYREGANYWKLQCYLSLNQNDKFLQESESFVKTYPKSTYMKNLMMIRGKVLIEKGDLSKALEEYKDLYTKTTNKNEKDATLEKIIEIILLSNDKKEAKVWIDKLNNTYKKAYYSSCYYRSMEMFDEARKSETILLQSNSYKDYALKNLADDEYASQNYKEALKYYQELDKLNVSSYKDYALYMIGNIYTKESKLKDAEVILTKVFVLYPQSDYVIPAQIKLAEIYEMNKNYDKAVAAYQEIDRKPKASEYHEFILEKLLYISLQQENKENVVKYYDELSKINGQSANKYKEIVEKIKVLEREVKIEEATSDIQKAEEAVKEDIKNETKVDEAKAQGTTAEETKEVKEPEKK